MRINIIIFLSGFVFSGCKSLDTYNSNEIEIIISDSTVLENFDWSLCLNKNKDTIVVLAQKESLCSFQDKYSLEEVNFVNDKSIGYRVNSISDYYIDGKLIFSKRFDVFILQCDE
jgi:hypothetical protein